MIVALAPHIGRLNRWLCRPSRLQIALGTCPGFILACSSAFGSQSLIILAFGVPALLSILELGERRVSRTQKVRDALTGLPLRDELVERADTALADGPTRAGSTATLAIGIDEFPDLEDRYGKEAGALVIRTCADRIRSVVRNTDILARLDGPNLALVLTGGSRADLESLIQLSTRLQKQVQDPIALDGTRLYVSASIGFCAPANCPERTGEALLMAAEQALDAARANGTGAIRAFSIDLRRRARTRGDLADELPLALEDNQIKPWFQPQVRTDTGEITGFEVLARWDHPQSGLIPPGEFLPTAENLGLLGRLGEVMLSQSLNALRAWDVAGCPVPNLSLNFTAEELRNPTIVDKIRWELDRYDISPERLTVEVLETVIAQTSNDTIIHNLRAFADLGCLIDLDDFGTGHASITNIRRFCVDRIKIDRSFVAQIDTDSEQQDLVAAILTLAHQMGLETLAEGVENPAEQAVLRQLGCEHVQGFGIARPMPFDEVEPWLDAYEKRRFAARPQSLADKPKNTPPRSIESGKTA